MSLRSKPTSRCPVHASMRHRPWRAIVRRDTVREEKSAYRGRSYSWRAIDVHTFTLECGHAQVRKGFDCPTTRVICKDCEAGEAPVEVTVEPGVFTEDNQGPKDPIARALIENAVEKARTT